MNGGSGFSGYIHCGADWDCRIGLRKLYDHKKSFLESCLSKCAWKTTSDGRSDNLFIALEEIKQQISNADLLNYWQHAFTCYPKIYMVDTVPPKKSHPSCSDV
mgnify:CR=1 FL=1